MKKFKFEVAKLNASPSYIEVDLKDSAPDFVKTRSDEGPARQIISLEGSVKLTGQDYDSIIGFGLNYSQNWINYRVSQWNFSTKIYEPIIKGICNVDTETDENQGFIKLTGFSNSDDNYSNIFGNERNKISVFNFITDRYVLQNTVTTVAYDVFSVPSTPYTPAAYQDNYMVNGQPNIFIALGGVKDTRWQYFIFVATGANNVHQYRTVGVDFKPEPENSQIYTEIIINNYYIGANRFFPTTKLWVTLPAVVGSVYSVVTTFARNAVTLIDVINLLISEIDSSLSFTASDVTYTGHQWTPVFDIERLHICQSSELVGEFGNTASLSFADVMEWMRAAFDLTWYISGSSLKLIHRTELGTSGTIDLTSITGNLQQRKLKENSLPTYENFKFKDAIGIWIPSGDPFAAFDITYLSSSLLLDGQRIVRENLVDLNTNVVLQKSSKIEINKSDYSLIEAEDTGAVRLVQVSAGIINNNLQSIDIFSYVNKSRYGDDADMTNRLKIGFGSLLDIEPKPLYQIEDIEYNPSVRLDLFDMTQEIIAAIGSTEAIELRHNLKEGKAKLKVQL